MSYVAVPREAIEEALKTAGFKAGSVGNEVVYSRQLINEPKKLCKPALVVKVYTTLPVEGEVVRACGEDAIRVCAIWNRICSKTQSPCLWDADNKCIDCGRKQEKVSYLESVAVYKDKRVYRTGTVEGVISRMKDRMRDAWEFAANTPVCNKCCALVFENGQCKIPECRAKGGRCL